MPKELNEASPSSGGDAVERRRTARFTRRILLPLLGVILVALSLAESWEAANLRNFTRSSVFVTNGKDHDEQQLLNNLDAINSHLERIMRESDGQRTTPDSDSQRQILEELQKNIHAISHHVANGSSAPDGAAASTGGNGTEFNKEQAKPKFPYHVLFCISGDKEGFLSEFEVSLKSVLLNAPLEAPLDVHVMADELAFQALDEKVWNQTGVEKFTTRHPIRIHVYNIQPLIPQFETMIVQLYKKAYKSDYGIGHSTHAHTIGAMFRLLAHLVVPKEVRKMLYLDPDAVVMANLQELWRNLEAEPVFHWGLEMCSGFVVLDVKQLPELWRLAGESPMYNVSEEYKQRPDDQLVFKSINVTFPERVGILPDAWDVSVATNVWRFKKELLERRPELGMIHLNGGGASTESAYLTHGFIHEDLEKFPDMKKTWGLVHYYARMPWEWARFLVSSMVDEDTNNLNATNTTKEKRRPGHPLTIIRHNDLGNNTAPAENVTTNAR